MDASICKNDNLSFLEALTMSESFELYWNRRQSEWRRRPQDAPWLLEAVLLQRTLIGGRPALKLVRLLGTIGEDELAAGDLAACERFWATARRKLGKLRRLGPRDRDLVEQLLARKVPRPMPVPATQAAG
jgi:hypothetical protein